MPPFFILFKNLRFGPFSIFKFTRGYCSFFCSFARKKFFGYGADSQVHYPVPDFFSAPDIPPLTTNVAARTTRNIHFRLVGVAAVGALPNEFPVFLLNLDFSIPTADLAVVGLRIDFSIHDGIVDILNQRDDRLQIVLQIRHFDVADSASGRAPGTRTRT